VGHRGKVAEREGARELRAEAWTLNEIAAELGVSRSSVSTWVRDVAFDEETRAARAGANRNRGARSRGPNKLAQRRIDEIAALAAEGRQRIGRLSERDLLIAGVALYAGEGAKTDGTVALANSDPRMVALFCRWLRRFFDIDEHRLGVFLYLHEGLDLDAACEYWAVVTGIPRSQFGKPYRATPDPSIRRSKHPMGCPRVSYTCSRTHRGVMGLVRALLSSELPSGVAQLAVAADC
jgi:predicted transcriptional regulator